MEMAVARPRSQSPPPVEPSLARVLTEIAEIAAETLDLQEVIDRVAACMRQRLDFDDIGIVRIVDGHHASLHASSAPGHDADRRPAWHCTKGADCSLPEPLTSWSPRLRPRPGDIAPVVDARVELDPSYLIDAALLQNGVRSALWQPIRVAGDFVGGVWLSSARIGTFCAEQRELLAPMAAVLGTVVEHWRLHEAERQRLEEARVAAVAQERADRLSAQVESLARQLRERRHDQVVGTSPAWRQVLTEVKRVAASETTVLVTGESGTGKEVVANLLHEGSPRSGRPLVAINCAALPEQLLESELFGHEKGSFTGAVASRMGRIEQAAGGTLFLDEIGEMSPMLQAKLLRVLEEREFQRLGGLRTLRADVRVVAATNRDLARAMAEGRFRDDLYYRLAVFEIRIPALRERPEDILALAEVFLEELAGTVARPAAGISRDAREWLLGYHWPGNVRELRNAIERAILLSDGGLITREHLPASVGRPEPARTVTGPGLLDEATPLPAGGVDLDSVERRLVEKALDQARGNKSKAARLLGLTRSQLYTRLDRHGLGG